MKHIIAICILSLALVACTGCVTTGGLVNAIPDIAAKGYNGRTANDASGSKLHSNGNTVNLMVAHPLPLGATINILTQSNGGGKSDQDFTGGASMSADTGTPKKSVWDIFKKDDPKPVEGME